MSVMPSFNISVTHRNERDRSKGPYVHIEREGGGGYMLRLTHPVRSMDYEIDNQ